MAYTLYIDESGDEGIEDEQIAAGASPLFFFGAFLILTKDIDHAKEKIADIEKRIERIGKGIHFKEIRNHSKKIRCCKDFAKLKIKAFGLISDKSQLDRKDYKKELRRWKGGYYNKNTAFLMEIIGKYCLDKDIIIDQIIFETKKNHSYTQMKNYLCAVRDDKYGLRNNLQYDEGWHHNANYLNFFDFQELICDKNKQEEALLSISDAIAYSLNLACITDKYGNKIYDYLYHMKNLFHSDENNKILGNGIKAVIDYDVMNIPQESKKFVSELKAT